MPFLIPVFAAVGTAIAAGAGIIGGALGAVGLTAIGGAVVTEGLALAGAAGFGAALSAWSTVALLASSGLTSHPVNNGGNPLNFQPASNGAVPEWIGRTASAGSNIYLTASDDAKFTWRHYFGVLSIGPMKELESFQTGDTNTAVSFSSSTYLATTSPFTGKMGLFALLGAETDPVLPLPTGTGPTPDWGSTDSLPGLASFRYCGKADSSLYPGGLPPPLFVGTGYAVYDPRADSTQPGGSGSQRRDDQTTWSFTGNDNPFLQALRRVIGCKMNSIPLCGIFAPDITIDYAAFIHGANVCDANGWTCGGIVASTDSEFTKLQALLQAGGGTPLILGGTISCFVQAPAVSIATIDADDITGQVSRARNASRNDRVNQVVATYRSEDHNWNQVAADAYTVDDYVTADGLKSQPVTYALVQAAEQARQLAAYAVYDSYEQTPITLTLGPSWRSVKPGDVFTPGDDLAALIRTTTDLRVLTRTFDPVAMAVTLVCRSETAGKHDAALGLTGGAPPVPTYTAPDPAAKAPAPSVGSWALSGTTRTSASGNAKPALEVTGVVDNTGASSVVFDLSTDGSTVLSTFGLFPREAKDKVFSEGIDDGGSYYMGVSYVVRGRKGETLWLGPVKAGTLVIAPSSGGGTPSLSDGDAPFDSSTPGSFSHTVPVTGHYDIEIWGAGGTAQADFSTPGDKKTPGEFNAASGAGGGGYSKKHISVTAGDVISGSIGAGSVGGMDGGDTTITSPSMTAHGGTSGSVDDTTSTAGTGGTASGGDTNTTGHAGGLSASTDGGGAGSGGGDQTVSGSGGTVPGGGGAAPSGLGQNGRVKFTFRTS